MTVGAVILAGGKSSRMGTDKGELKIWGLRFLDRLAQEFEGFSELLVSVNQEEKYPGLECSKVSDLWKDCGPMGGLHAALKSCRSDALVVVPCDVPFFSREVADAMCACLDEETDVVTAVTADGKGHPLCGVYRKRCYNVLEQCLREKNYKMTEALSRLRKKECPMGKFSWRLQNINTPKEFQMLQNRSCLAVCGWKNSGKTTLIEKLIPCLTQQGLRVATIKHDGHSYTPDVPGTDSHRFFQAGASTSIIYDQEKYSISRRGRVTEQELLSLAPEADLILLEGAKWTDYPKLEILRKENKKAPIPGLRGRIAYVSDQELGQDLTVFGLEEIPEIADYIMKAFVDGTLRERWKEEEHESYSGSMSNADGSGGPSGTGRNSG